MNVEDTEVELPAETIETAETTETEGEEKGEAEAKPDETPEAKETTKSSDVLTVDLSSDDDDELPSAPDKATAAFAKLRFKEKEARQKLREVEARAAQMAAELAARSETESADADPGPMPSLKDSDWDEAEHAKALLQWGEKKRSHDSTLVARRKAAEAEAKEWEATQAAYHDKRKAYLESHPDRLEEGENFVKASFSPVQRAAMVDVLKDAPLMCIALAKNPDRAKSLANIQSMPRFVAELARMEAGMVKKTPATQPEKKVSSGAPVADNDKTLARLEAEADKSGNRSKIVAYKREQRLKNSQK
jgi:hypothetical protein